MTISLGCWMLPTLITLVAILFAINETRRAVTWVEAPGPVIVSLIAWLVAICVILSAWLAWSITR